jgi:hypothetical protein
LEKGAKMSSKLFARRKKEADDDIIDDVQPEVAEPGEAPLEPPMEPPMDGAVPPGGPAPVGGPAAPPPPSATPTAGNPFAALPTEVLTVVIEAISKIDGFESQPATLGAIEQVAEELKNRPMAPPEQAGGAPAGAPMKASLKKKTDVPADWRGVTAAMTASGMTGPQANVLAYWMKNEGYLPHKAAFLIKRGRAKFLLAKFASSMIAAAPGVPPVNEDTLNKVEGQPHDVPEIGEAHGDREGVDKAEAHNSNPGASVTEIKDPQSLNKQAKEAEISSALKLAETIEKKLGSLYMDAKPIVRANSGAQVTAAVEGIYDTMNKFAEAKKVLNKYEMQAANEDEAIKAVEKKDKKDKKASFDLTLAASE